MNLQLLPSDIEAYLKEVKNPSCPGIMQLPETGTDLKMNNCFWIMYCLSPRPGKFCSV